MTDYSALQCEASAYARANAAEERVRELEARIERLDRAVTAFVGAALCALGLNRDESVVPGHQVLDGINALREKSSSLERVMEAGNRLRKIAELYADDIAAGFYAGEDPGMIGAAIAEWDAATEAAK